MLVGSGLQGAVRVDPTYRDALAFLTSHPDMERGDPLPSELNLDRTRALLAALNRPDRAYRSILIAGTKGKGSTAAMIERALRAAGYRTGLYTQPHLHTIRERSRLDGQPLEPRAFAEGVQRVRAAAERSGDSRFTTYELMTAMVLDRFAVSGVDIAVLEVGLGGRLDATNVVESDVSVLTSISLDHTRILGSTVAAIAREKADIIKRGRPVVSAPQRDEAMAVIASIAASRSAPLQVAGQSGANWQQANSAGWDLIVGDACLSNVRPALRGGFQRTNAAVAATVLTTLAEVQGLAVLPQHIRIGVEDVCWLGRFETIEAAPPVVLDAAHNVESAHRLREALAEECGGRQPLYVLGVAADKDLAGIVAALCAPGGIDRAAQPALVVTTEAEHPRAASAAHLATLVRAQGVPVALSSSVADALDLARREATGQQVVVATGSFHVVAEARIALGLAPPADEDPFDPWGTR